MSKIMFFDLDNRAVGHVTAICNRGWQVYGNTGVSSSGLTTITLPKEAIENKWIQLGRLVLVQATGLPDWIGVVDTPWKATLPAQITLYSVEYLFSLRSPETAIRWIGTIASLIKELIRQANEQENLFLSLGEVTGAQTEFEEPIDQRKMWDQIVPLLERTGYEMDIRAERGADKRLYLYADVGQNLGIDTGFLLHDSEIGKNMKPTGARVGGEIHNRVKGTSGQSNAEDQLETEVLENEDSQGLYRTRSVVTNFRSITQLSQLTEYAQTELDAESYPYIEIEMEIYDVGETFANVRHGNRLLFTSSNLFLPGGVRSWSGTVRILAMAYDEARNVILARARGAYI